MENIATIEKKRVAILVRLDRVTNIPRVPDEPEPLTEIHNAMGQPKADMQKAEEGRKHPLGDPNDPEATTYAVDRIDRHSSTKAPTEYKVQCSGY